MKLLDFDIEQRGDTQGPWWGVLVKMYSKSTLRVWELGIGNSFQHKKRTRVPRRYDNAKSYNGLNGMNFEEFEGFGWLIRSVAKGLQSLHFASSSGLT